jgi:putative tryptophan/tyrosine transport system substrate-binding protein
MIKRREFITLVGGAAAWPLATRAQQPPMPVVGFLGTTSMAATGPSVAAFSQGLKENGYVEGKNVTIEFRWGEAQLDRLQGLAADLVSRPVAVMFAGGAPAALAAKAATTKIPVVFTSGADPVKIGLVSSLNRPDANVTGVSILFRELEAKRLELLRELVPTARAVGLIFDSITSSEEAEIAARHLGLRFHSVPVATEDQLDAAFSSLVDRRVDVVVVGSSPRIGSWRQQIIRLAARTSLPAIYELRQYVRDGGLISYGASVTYAYRQAGTYVARILKGEKPGDLPVVQPTKFDLVINLKTAKALSIEVPPTLLARADEVIE